MRWCLLGLVCCACTPSRSDYAATWASPSIDGSLDDWRQVPAIEGFTRSRGDAPSRLMTTARIAYDAANLYVAFTTEDPDIRATHLRHDEPIYREEAVEMFIEPVAGSGNYIELQSSPRSVTFDAAFTGGARKNMRRAFDADFDAVCTVDGTINDATDVDRGWTCEWRVGLASLPGVVLPVGPGTHWRVNLFRIAKDDGRAPDESAWSPPMRGDFHTLERFKVLSFHDR